MANILSEPDLKTYIQSVIPDNSTGQISPADVRLAFDSIIESLQAYGGVITDGIIAVTEVTTTPAKWTNFTGNATAENDLLRADYLNSRIVVKQSGLYFVSIAFNGSWPAVEDLQFDVFVNSAANPFTPICIPKAGKGAGDPEVIETSGRSFLVTSAMLVAGGGEAVVELYATSLTGTFDVAQTDVTFGLSYNPLSVGTV